MIRSLPERTGEPARVLDFIAITMNVPIKCTFPELAQLFTQLKTTTICLFSLTLPPHPFVHSDQRSFFSNKRPSISFCSHHFFDFGENLFTMYSWYTSNLSHFNNQSYLWLGCARSIPFPHGHLSRSKQLPNACPAAGGARWYNGG